MRLKQARLQTGVTLIELVISIVVISVSMVGIFSVINMTTAHSGDPVVRHQALAIAESYLDEILLQNYASNASVTCTTSTVRANFNCVDNYNGLTDVGVHNQQGLAVTELSQYTVKVSVSAAMTLANNVNAKQITVSVTGPGSASSLSLTGYRAQY